MHFSYGQHIIRWILVCLLIFLHYFILFSCNTWLFLSLVPASHTQNCKFGDRESTLLYLLLVIFSDSLPSYLYPSTQTYLLIPIFIQLSTYTYLHIPIYYTHLYPSTQIHIYSYLSAYTIYSYLSAYTIYSYISAYTIYSYLSAYTLSLLHLSHALSVSLSSTQNLFLFMATFTQTQLASYVFSLSLSLFLSLSLSLSLTHTHTHTHAHSSTNTINGIGSLSTGFSQKS